jgi:hypothetical protein
MPRLRKAELEAKYKVPIYVVWDKVPVYLKSRSWFQQNGITIAKSEPPDAVKGGGNISNTIYFLFDLRKYNKGLFEQLQKEAVESERQF